MTVIERAKENLRAASFKDERTYWSAYIAGAKAQAAEDLRAIRKELECEKKCNAKNAQAISCAEI